NYWRYTDGIWYRSASLYEAPLRVQVSYVPLSVRRVERPAAYVYYRAPRAVARVRVTAAAHIYWSSSMPGPMPGAASKGCSRPAPSAASPRLARLGLGGRDRHIHVDGSAVLGQVVELAQTARIDPAVPALEQERVAPLVDERVDRLVLGRERGIHRELARVGADEV